MDFKIKWCLFIFLFQAIVFGSIGFAKPAIDIATPENIYHNGNLSISGKGFGIKKNVAPLHFDDFESSTIGKSVGSELSHWSEKPTEISQAIISNENLRNTRTTRNLKSSPTSSSIEAWINDIGFAATGKAYINFWVRVDFGTGTNPAYQLKMLRIGVGVESNAAAILPTLLLTHWTGGSFPEPGGSVQSYHQLYNGYPSHNIYWPKNTFNQEDTAYKDGSRIWVNLAIQLDEGDQDKANAQFSGWVQSPDKKSTIAKKEDFNFLFRDTSDHINAIGIHNYLGVGSKGDAVIYYDDFYLDNSWARIEIGDNINYDSCKHREIQIPTTWSSDGTSITIIVNQGSFNPCERVYLFVIDENGVPSAGKPVRFTSGTAKPCPPSPFE